MSVYRPTHKDPNTGETVESPVWWYEFVYRSKRYRERTGVTNKQDAKRIEAARKTHVANERVGHAKNSKSRTIKLTPRARQILEQATGRTGLVFRNGDAGPLYHTWLDQQHADVRGRLGFPKDFVLHSLRHTFGTRLGESGADAFTIMRLMGHSSVTVSQKYVHPSTESMNQAIDRMADGSQGAQRVPNAPKLVKPRKREVLCNQ